MRNRPAGHQQSLTPLISHSSPAFEPEKESELDWGESPATTRPFWAKAASLGKKQSIVPNDMHMPDIFMVRAPAFS
jgi:hypothetical protein